MLFSRTSIVTFPNFLAHESFLVEHQKLPLSLPSLYSYSDRAVKSKHVMKGVLISQAKSNPLQVLCCSPLCTYPIRPLSRAVLVFPSKRWYILAVKCLQCKSAILRPTPSTPVTQWLFSAAIVFPLQSFWKTQERINLVCGLHGPQFCLGKAGCPWSFLGPALLCA